MPSRSSEDFGPAATLYSRMLDQITFNIMTLYVEAELL